MVILYLQVQADSILRASRGLNLFFYQILLVTLTFEGKVTEIIFLNAKIRKVFSYKGRLLVRASGTEPKIRIMCESFNSTLIDKCLNIVEKSIH